MDNIKKRVFSGAITGLLQNVLAMGIQLVMAPIILAFAGQDTMGSYAILMQIVGYTILLDLGFSVSLQRFLSQAADSEDANNNFAALFKIGKIFLLVINIIISFCIFILAFQFNLFFKIDNHLFKQAQIALCLQALWILLRTPMYVYNSALLATQEMAILNLIAIPVNVFRLFLSLILLNSGLGLIGLVFANIFSEMIGYLAQRFFFLKKHFSLINVPSQKIDLQLLRKVFRFGLSYWGVNLSVVLLLGSDNLIVGALFGTVGASVYYTTKMIGSLVVTIISRAIDNVFSGIAFLSGKQDQTELKKIYLQSLRFVMATVIPLTFAIILFTKWLVIVWVGPNQYAGDIMVLFISCFVLFQVIAHLHGIFTLAIGNLKDWNTISIIAGFLSVFLSYKFGKELGIEFITAGICISVIMIAIFLVFKVIKTLNISSVEFVQNLLPASPIIIVFFILLWAKTLFIYSHKLLVVFVIFYGINWIFILWFLVIKHNERIAIYSWINKKLKLKA